MNLRERAKALRSQQTEAEQRLWYHLRAHRFMGLKFRRQKPVGRYIVDFMCHERRLIVEVDGGQHATQTGYDEARDAWLCEQGYQVLRFWNHEVMQELDAVLERIRSVVEPSPPAPLPQAGEGSTSVVEPSAPTAHAAERRRGNAKNHSSPLPLAGDERKTDVKSEVSPLPLAGDERKTDVKSEISPLPLAGDERTTDAKSEVSPLPLAGEGLGEREKE